MFRQRIYKSNWKNEKNKKSFIQFQEETENAVQNVLGDNSDDVTAQMDPKNMKVAELRTELEARNLSSKGKHYHNSKVEILKCNFFLRLEKSIGHSAH